MKRDIKMFMAGMGAAIMYEQIKKNTVKSENQLKKNEYIKYKM